MKNKETVSWQDQKASERFAMISPLLADDLDPAKRSQIRSRIAETNSVSERTLYLNFLRFLTLTLRLTYSLAETR